MLTRSQLVRTSASREDVDIIPTFASGTMLVTNRVQRGRNDMSQIYMEPETASPATPEPEPENVAGDESSPTEVPPTVSAPPMPRRPTTSAYSTSRNSDPVPLAVLNLYDLAYMGDKYGVWDKKQYAADWWRSLNWQEIVRKNAK